MCNSKKSIRICEKCQNNNQIPLIKVNWMDSCHKENEKDSVDQNFQLSDQHIELIRSNKKIIQKHLRNSLIIPKLASFKNLKDEKLTAASLKDLDQQDSIFSNKDCLEIENLNSSRLLVFPTQKLITEIFSDKYTIVKKLGQGAHSTVYKCTRKIDNKPFALKKIKNVSYENWRKLKNLYQMIKNLHHQSIIKYHDYFFDQQKRTAYVVMEYCDFNDLRFQLSKRSLSGKIFTCHEILAITKEITSVLKYLHSEGICHRDLKPENILYSQSSGAIKIIDLDVCGVKKYKNENFDMWTSTGTLFYRAPQSFQIGYTEKVDIWSLGIVIYELLTGRLPFQTEYQKDFYDVIKYSTIDFDSIEANSKIKQILKRCLQKQPTDRISVLGLNSFLNFQTKKDEVLDRKQHQTNKFRKAWYIDDDKQLICLGSLLKFSYS